MVKLDPGIPGFSFGFWVFQKKFGEPRRSGRQDFPFPVFDSLGGKTENL